MENKNNLKIFLIDDDKFLLDMYSIKFKTKGYEVFTAHDGADAMQQIKGGFVPDIILLDVVMPQVDGLTFLSNMRGEKLLPKAIVIMLTNQGQVSDIEKAESLKVDGYIIKATSIPSEVVAEVERIVAEKSKMK